MYMCDFIRFSQFRLINANIDASGLKALEEGLKHWHSLQELKYDIHWLLDWCEYTCILVALMAIILVKMEQKFLARLWFIVTLYRVLSKCGLCSVQYLLVL